MLVLSAPRRRPHHGQRRSAHGDGDRHRRDHARRHSRSDGDGVFVSNPLMANITRERAVIVLPLFAPGCPRGWRWAPHRGRGGEQLHVRPWAARQPPRQGRARTATPLRGPKSRCSATSRWSRRARWSTDEGGNFELPDVNAGQFTLTVIDPATGDRGKAFATIDTEGQNAAADVRLNGQGTVVVTVLDSINHAVPTPRSRSPRSARSWTLAPRTRMPRGS